MNNAASSEFGANLTIDLAAIVANWRLLGARAPSAECGAVVKADAYGCGIEKVVPALAKAGCRTFFVAHLSEARRVRAVARDAVIYVLNGLLPGAAPHLLAIDARPVLGSGDEIAEWSRMGGGQPCAIHVDTGMNRLGLSVAEVDKLTSEGAFEALAPSLLMTHLSAAEMPEDVANLRQVTAFAAIAELFPELPGSLLNSSGHFLAGARPYELTRPGFALYGGNPTPHRSNPMQPVIRLTSRILQTRIVSDGGGVGYNSRWHANGQRKLATIQMGYADGYPRNASCTDIAPGGHVLLDGVRCPFAGTVSMDLIIVDVSDAPAGSAVRGAEVVLIGDGLDIDAVAASAKTVGYEMLTNLGRRYQRSYLEA